MQILMLQHGDLFENLSVAPATVLRERFAADEELRDSFVRSIVGDSWRLGSLSSSILQHGDLFQSMPSLSQTIAGCLVIGFTTRNCRRGNSLNQKKMF